MGGAGERGKKSLQKLQGWGGAGRKRTSAWLYFRHYILVRENNTTPRIHKCPERSVLQSNSFEILKE